MKALNRNKQIFWYCTVQTKDGNAITQEIVDERGNRTGQHIVMYNDPVEIKANISPATGQSNTEQFGNLENYDKVIVTDDLECPIDENSVLFIDKAPVFTQVTTNDVVESNTLFGDDVITKKTYNAPAYDYIVWRIAKSLNSVSIAVRKVNVS